MKYLVFDTETVGLPINSAAPVTALDNWPRLVQLSWFIFDEDARELEKANFIVKPDGFSIPYESTKIHGITTERANRQGVSIFEALNKFIASFRGNGTTLVAHNLEFDDKVVGAELLRYKISSNFFDLPRVCTMRLSTDFCALPNNKPPRLTQLYFKLFGINFADAHQADVDARACARCFFELKKLGVIKEDKKPAQGNLF